MLDRVVKQLFDDLSQVFGDTEEAFAQSPARLRAVIEASLRKLKLVTREEFDAQQAVLLRTREKLEGLEKHLAEIEEALSKNVDLDNAKTER